MRKEYEDIAAREVCKLSNWKAASLPDKQGVIGVACVLAYLRGVKAIAAELAAHIGVPLAEVEIPFKRLQVNGTFSSKMDILNDPIFAEHKEVSPTDDFYAQNALCIIAGIASGYTGLRETAENEELATAA